MKFCVKDMDIATGGPFVAIINRKDANYLDLHHGDRVRIKYRRRSSITIIDIAESNKSVAHGKIGLFEELLKDLNVKEKDYVSLQLVEKPRSIGYIRKKLDGEKLSALEIERIIEDIVDNKLSEAELAYFVSAFYTHITNMKETAALTKAMIKTGDTLYLKSRVVMDKHCIGGVAGNRTTMIVVPIIAAAGLIIPKTSSRSITSPAGTADTMEVIAPVSFSFSEMKRIIRKTGACMVWGGSINLAPADDKIIRVEHPLDLDSRSQLLASILAKKASVSATHVLVDIPVGNGAKIEKMKRGMILKREFEIIGKSLGMHMKVIITDGSEPVGNGLGPLLEARDVLYVLRNDDKMPRDLKNRCVMIAGLMLEMGKKAKKGKGKSLALDILESGKAYKKFIQIVIAQGGKEVDPDKMKLSRFKSIVRTKKSGTIKHIDNKSVSKVARKAGAPLDKEAGVYLHAKKNSKIKKGDPLFTIYANSRDKLRFAINTYNEIGGIFIK